MIRSISHYLLIAVVLLCPHLCLAKAAGAVGTPCQTACCACAKHKESSSDETPEPPDENETDCLCHGAIMDGVRSAELDIPSPLTIDWQIEDALRSSVKSSLAEASSEPPHQFPPFSTGRDICVLTCALLL